MSGSVKTEDDDKREAALRFLSRPRELDKAIRRKKEQIDGLRSSLTSISVSYSDMPKGGSGPGSRIEDGIVGLMGLEEEVAALETERSKIVSSIAATISLISKPEEQQVLAELYLLGKGWDEAVEATEFSREKFRKLRREAINDLSSILWR